MHSYKSSSSSSHGPSVTLVFYTGVAFLSSTLLDHSRFWRSRIKTLLQAHDSTASLTAAFQGVGLPSSSSLRPGVSRTNGDPNDSSSTMKAGTVTTPSSVAASTIATAGDTRSNESALASRRTSKDPVPRSSIISKVTPTTSSVAASNSATASGARSNESAPTPKSPHVPRSSIVSKVKPKFIIYPATHATSPHCGHTNAVKYVRSFLPPLLPLSLNSVAISVVRRPNRCLQPHLQTNPRSIDAHMAFLGSMAPLAIVTPSKKISSAVLMGPSDRIARVQEPLKERLPRAAPTESTERVLSYLVAHVAVTDRLSTKCFPPSFTYAFSPQCSRTSSFNTVFIYSTDVTLISLTCRKLKIDRAMTPLWNDLRFFILSF
ncbi:hypothetical protein R3P38DRAFT_3175565 [Favolaschia claudopus]|uniref:Uncharacterized protein n=1 Tax=Favolaschia claudopus TaxID=2862362 RepID=A0AAW0D3E8_9AGAR